MLGNKTNNKKFKKIKIIPNIFSDHNGMKLEINNRGKMGKFIKMWRLNKMPLNNQWVTRNQKGNQKIPWNGQKWKNRLKLMGCSKSSAKRDVYSNKCLH